MACSGGLDSLVLLHLLRFSGAHLGLKLATAHFDHGMRFESQADREWLQGLTKAWHLPLCHDRAAEVPSNEATARALRYQFLEGLIRSDRFDHVVTAHHADDQAETVLFRILRGTGVDGLRGIPVSRRPGILRPLMPFDRIELEEYARSSHLRPRVDATNESSRFARNRIRHQLLPLLEVAHPGARRALRRLARNSRRTAEALDALVDLRLEEVIVKRERGQIVLHRDRLLDHPEPVIGALIRRVAAAIARPLSEAGTDLATEFVATGSSGARLDLPGPVCLIREFDRIRVRGSLSTPEGTVRNKTDEPSIEIGVPDPGQGGLYLSGRRYRVVWGVAPDLARDQGGSRDWEWAEFALDKLRFPLRMRSWRPGDRIQIRSGRKKLKKIFREFRVPRDQRDQLPVLVDSEGLVLWMCGSSGVRGRSGLKEERIWRLGVGQATHG